MLEPPMRGFSFVRLQASWISRLTDAVSGDSLTAGEAPATLALSGDVTDHDRPAVIRS